MATAADILAQAQLQDIKDALLQTIADRLDGVTIDASDIEIGAVEVKDGTTDARAKVGAVSGLATSDIGFAAAALLLAGESHVGEVGGHGDDHSDEFSAVGGAYSQYDRIAASASDTGTVVLRTLFTARKNGGSGYITKARLHVNKTGLTGTVRVHLYNVNQPTTAVPGDNAAYPIKYANRAQRIGHFDMTLGAPGAAGSDVSHSIDRDIRVHFKCADADNKIYYGLEDRTGMTLDTPTPLFLAVDTDED